MTFDITRIGPGFLALMFLGLAVYPHEQRPLMISNYPKADFVRDLGPKITY